MFKHRFLLIAVIALIILTVGCGDIENTENSGQAAVVDTAGGSYEKISPEKAKKRLQENKGIILLDVRTVEEYTESHIPGSMLIPVDEIGAKAPSKLKDKNATIFVYCRSGNRAAQAAQEMADMGYKNISDLGGILDWPYETESGPPQD